MFQHFTILHTTIGMSKSSSTLKHAKLLQHSKFQTLNLRHDLLYYIDPCYQHGNINSSIHPFGWIYYVHMIDIDSCYQHQFIHSYSCLDLLCKHDWLVKCLWPLIFELKHNIVREKTGVVLKFGVVKEKIIWEFVTCIALHFTCNSKFGTPRKPVCSILSSLHIEYSTSLFFYWWEPFGLLNNVLNGVVRNP